MSYEFKRLADVEALSEVPENATVIAEVNGSIKRVPGNGLGGSGNGIVLVMDAPDTPEASPNMLVSADPALYTFTANMDFADAMEAFRAYEITSAVVYGLGSVMGLTALESAAVEDSYVMDVAIVADGTANFGIDCLVFMTMMSQMTIFWTAYGISTEPLFGSDEK